MTQPESLLTVGEIARRLDQPTGHVELILQANDDNG